MDLEVIIDGKVGRVLALKPVGCYLLCRFQDQAEKIVPVKQARDVNHYWDVWEYLMDGQTLQFEDGRVWEPRKSS